MAYNVKPPEIRFWRKVDQCECGCWIWKGKCPWFYADKPACLAVDFAFGVTGKKRTPYSKMLCGTAACIQPLHWGLKRDTEESKSRKQELARRRFRRLRDEQGELLNIRARERYWADPEAARAKVRAWKKANPEKVSYRAQLKRASDPMAFKAKRAANDHVRRARLRGGAVEKVSVLELIKRDAGVCQICGGEGDGGDKWSIDHIIPISKGGEHTYANTRLAHMKCNAGRSNRMVDISGNDHAMSGMADLTKLSRA